MDTLIIMIITTVWEAAWEIWGGSSSPHPTPVDKTLQALLLRGGGMQLPLAPPLGARFMINSDQIPTQPQP